MLDKLDNIKVETDASASSYQFGSVFGEMLGRKCPLLAVRSIACGCSKCNLSEEGVVVVMMGDVGRGIGAPLIIDFMNLAQTENLLTTVTDQEVKEVMLSPFDTISEFIHKFVDQKLNYCWIEDRITGGLVDMSGEQQPSMIDMPFSVFAVYGNNLAPKLGDVLVNAGVFNPEDLGPQEGVNETRPRADA